MKVLLSDGEPWFRGTDVAGALGYRNKQQALRVHVDVDDKSKLDDLRQLESSSPLNANEKYSLMNLACIV